jgi:hypothetical protein
MMRRVMAVVLGLLLIALATPSVALAQSTVQVQGTIQSVDCGTHTLFLRGAPGVVNTIPGNSYTAVFVNGAPVPFCTLQQYVGGYAVATVTAAGNELVAGRIDVLLAAAPAPAPYYYPYYFPYTYYPWNYYGPPWVPGIGIGIVIGPGRYHYHHRRSVGTPPVPWAHNPPRGHVPPLGVRRYPLIFHGGSNRAPGRGARH